MTLARLTAMHAARARRVLAAAAVVLWLPVASLGMGAALVLGVIDVGLVAGAIGLAAGVVALAPDELRKRRR